MINDGGTEAQAIVALLHDAVEDQGGPDTLAEIRSNFGDDARIVDESSDTDEIPKPPWRERKTKYITHLADTSWSTTSLTIHMPRSSSPTTR